MGKVISAREAVDLIQDGMTLGLSGFIGFGVAEEVLVALENKYLQERSPRDLFLFHAAGIGGDGKNRGTNHFAHPGLLRKLYCGHNGLSPKISAQVAANQYPAYMVPQGVASQLIRAIAGGKPGVITHVGLKTFADPRIEGCKVNDICTEEIVQLMEIDGQEYLFYKAFPIDICLIKGTTGDEYGNITLEKEAVYLEQFDLAAATRNSGGIVIAQVDRLAQRGSLDPRKVVVPGVIVDYIVVGSPEHSRQSYAVAEYMPSWSGEVKVPLSDMKTMPLNLKKICGRRGAMELKKNDLVNLGIGVPEAVSSVAGEEGISGEIVLTIESGVMGGVPAGGLGTGASNNPEAIIKHPEMFDLYDGGGIDIAYLGAAQIDQQGNVNVSKFAERVVGPGGFINISQNAKRVCFLCAFMTGKIKAKIEQGKLEILEDGAEVKFKQQVEQITFSGEYAREVGQRVLYITERAVFELRKEGVTLIETAPGIDLERDILAKMEFRPLIAKDLKTMDGKIFKDELMGLVLEQKEGERGGRSTF